MATSISVARVEDESLRLSRSAALMEEESLALLKLSFLTPTERRERRIWTQVDDVVLISSWLNTSKDCIVGNKQRYRAFWKRNAAYFAASPKVSGCEQRTGDHCTQRWQKINDAVNKFCGAYEAASRERSSGHDENDVLNTKRTKLDDSAQSSSSYATETTTGEADQGCNRPPGVKASKGHGKKKMAEGKEKQSRMTFSEFQSMWSLKKEDLSQKEKLSKIKLLDSLLAKQEPLADYEEALKKKLINELLA
ncbi:glutathione S-transferase T3-like [Brassica napus]|uniref:glutathione S-transferase T3-like n=1 Tax=Brassica napus TaxID=3708 RepID=UPI0006AA60EC|nr:glutathione S-transferase T3-like [Brassica napus]